MIKNSEELFPFENFSNAHDDLVRGFRSQFFFEKVTNVFPVRRFDRLKTFVVVPRRGNQIKIKILISLRVKIEVDILCKESERLTKERIPVIQLDATRTSAISGKKENMWSPFVKRKYIANWETKLQSSWFWDSKQILQNLIESSPVVLGATNQTTCRPHRDCRRR